MIVVAAISTFIGFIIGYITCCILVIAKESDEEYTENILCENFDNDGTSLYTEDEIKKAVLYGLSEGRKERWHDLREDPNDLPKESGYYFVSRYSNYLRRKRHSQILFYIKGKRNGWNTKMDKTQIIAWCELPKFEE